MKDLTKLKSNVYSSTSVDVVNRNMINRQMFHHYRRVLSARKVVDSSPPFAYRTRPQSTRQGRKTRPRREEVDTKERCIVTEMFGLSYGDGRRARSELDVRTPSSPVYVTQQKNHGCLGVTGNGRQSAANTSGVKRTELLGTSFTRTDELFRPAILRRDAESKVRGLRVYHPPRKRSSQREKEDGVHVQRVEAEVTSGESSARSTATGSGEPWASADELPSVGVCFCGAAKSKVSSCDSAYNGGGTSSAPESGGSSPARRRVLARDSSFIQFVDGTGRKDAASQTESDYTASNCSVGQAEVREEPTETAILGEGQRKWNFTDLYLYPDPFDDDLLLEECMRGLNLSAEDSYAWSDVPSLSGELFV